MPGFELLELLISLCGHRQKLSNTERVRQPRVGRPLAIVAIVNTTLSPTWSVPRAFGIPSTFTLESQFRQQRIALNIARSGWSH